MFRVTSSLIRNSKALRYHAPPPIPSPDTMFVSVILKLLPTCQDPTLFSFALWVLNTDTQTTQFRGPTFIIFDTTHINYRKTTKF